MPAPAIGNGRASCASRPSPPVARSASHAGDERPNPRARPIVSGQIAERLRPWLNALRPAMPPAPPASGRCRENRRSRADRQWRRPEKSPALRRESRPAPWPTRPTETRRTRRARRTNRCPPANDPTIKGRHERDHQRSGGEIASSREQITAHAENEEMRHGSAAACCGKESGNFQIKPPRHYENGKRAVLKFAGEVAQTQENGLSNGR